MRRATADPRPSIARSGAGRLAATLAILIAACDGRSASGTVPTARRAAATLPVHTAPSDTLQRLARAACEDVAAGWRDIPNVSIHIVGDTMLDAAAFAADSGRVAACQVVAEDSVAFTASDSAHIQRDGSTKSTYWQTAERSRWVQLGHLAADGPDGSVIGYQRGPVRCLVDGAWDGGDDSDSTYVPSPWYRETTSCWLHTRPLSAQDTT